MSQYQSNGNQANNNPYYYQQIGQTNRFQSSIDQQKNNYRTLSSNLETLSLNSTATSPQSTFNSQQTPQQLPQQHQLQQHQQQQPPQQSPQPPPQQPLQPPPQQPLQQHQQQPLQQNQQQPLQQHQPQQHQQYANDQNSYSSINSRQQQPQFQAGPQELSTPTYSSHTQNETQVNQQPPYVQTRYNGDQQYYGQSAQQSAQSNVTSGYNKLTQPPMQNRYPPIQPSSTQSNFYQQQPSINHQMPPPPQQSFYGAQPGMPPSMGQPAMNQFGGQQYGQSQQSKTLNPDSIPSVIQVIDDDNTKWFEKGFFEARIPSDLPPIDASIETINPSTGHRIKVIDAGCSRPNHMRSSLYNIPITEELIKNTALPFNVVIKPFDEYEVDDNPENRIEIPVSPSEIVRCNRCKAYMSPYMRFTDGGRRFQCGLCYHTNEITNTYFVQLDHNEQRLDKFQRPELHLGSYEFRTNEEFYRNKVMASRRPHIVFAFELTINSKPLIQLISANLADVIKNSLPLDVALNCPPPLVGFITYNSKIQLYDILNNSTAHIISDVAHTFPSFTTFLVDPITHMDKIEEFLAKLPTLHSDSDLETETIFGPVIEAAFQTCNVDSSNWFANQEVKDKSKVIAVGKIYMFHCSLPTFGQDGATPGRLKKRWTTVDEEAKRLLGTDKEKNILTPESSKYYTKLGERCVTDYGSGVELFLFPPSNGSFLDIATISELTRLTGTGGIYKYFNDYSTRFLQDLKQSLKSTMAFDCLIKVRASTGIRPVDYIGNYHSRNVSDIEIASLSAGNSISVEFKHDDKLNENEFVIIQVATLYTAVSGDRRVRIHNLALSTCTQLGDVFRSANCDSMMNHLFRSCIQSLRLGQKTIQDVKNNLINRVVQILTAYRRNCASATSSPGQLILPETLKLLPVYVTGAIKCDAINGGFEMMPDEKAFAQARSLGANCSYSQVILYPSLLKLYYNVQSQLDGLESKPLRSAYHRLNEPDGVAYILENGFYVFLYLPNNPEVVDQPKFIRNVFGVNSINEINIEKDLPQLDTEESNYLNSLLNQIRKKRKMAMKVYIVRQAIDKNELIFKFFLYEDKKPLSSVTSGHNNFESPSYVDLLCHLHTSIKQSMQ